MMVYFVLMIFNFLGLWTKLFAYALGTNFLSFGSWTKYSYPCLLAKLIASSFVLNGNRTPFIKSAEDCHPMRGFSQRCPLGSGSQSINQLCECHSPDCVAAFVGRYILVVVSSRRRLYIVDRKEPWLTGRFELEGQRELPTKLLQQRSRRARCRP